MVQNRNKLIELFIGNISNGIVHEILAKAIDDDNIRKHYSQELKVSLSIARKYRKKINPINTTLPDKDIDYIKDKIIKKVKSELELRISKGYKNIDIDLVEVTVKNMLKNVSVID